MTKFNWEKANKRDRQNNFLLAIDALSANYVKKGIDFDISNPSHNPLNLCDEDCRGKIPSEEKRNLIVKYLVSSSEFEFISHDSIDLSKNISGKSFYEFSWKIFTSDFDWSKNKTPIKFVMPIAVCFSVVYLRIYNTVISPKEKASQLTLETIQKIHDHKKNNHPLNQ